MSIVRGERFGRWVALTDYSRATGKVLCRCDCGTERDVNVRNLKSIGAYSSQSCGCLKRERVSKRHFKHGAGYGDYRYRAWQTIKGKCLCETHADWAYYGGRGIGIYQPWMVDFAVFAEYLDKYLGPRPEGSTLDRINNDGDYVPGNLRWATRQEQSQNRRQRLPARFYPKE